MTNKHISICFATFTLSLFLFCWSISKIETNDWKETFISRLKLSGELSGIQIEVFNLGVYWKTTLFSILVLFPLYSTTWYSFQSILNSGIHLTQYSIRNILKWSPQVSHLDCIFSPWPILEMDRDLKLSEGEIRIISADSFRDLTTKKFNSTLLNFSL